MENKEFETEWTKMLKGERYNAVHPGFLKRLMENRDRIWELNNIRPTDIESQLRLLRGMLGHLGKNPVINQPFRCDFGCNISIGDNVVINFNMTILDEGLVTIGDNVFIGPNCSIYTPCHPIEAKTRDKGIEWALPVTIGNHVWIGGSTTLLPGVTIGDGSVIGAGSVVTRSIPANSVAVGNPCQVIKQIDKP